MEIEPGDLVCLNISNYKNGSNDYWEPLKPNMKENDIALVIDVFYGQTSLMTGNYYWRIEILWNEQVWCVFTQSISESFLLKQKVTECSLKTASNGS